MVIVIQIICTILQCVYLWCLFCPNASSGDTTEMSGLYRNTLKSHWPFNTVTKLKFFIVLILFRVKKSFQYLYRKFFFCFGIRLGEKCI